ncbi:MAG: hypothetical protein ACOCX0_01185 [Bacteroidota bacterium]
MKTRLFAFAGLFFSLLIFNSCENDNDLAEQLLYGSENGSGPTIDISLDMVNAWYLTEGNIIYGLDVTILNQNDEMISDVYVELTSVSPTSDVAEISSADIRYINSIPAYGSAIPDNYWCFDCGTAYEVYIGHFYVIVYPYVGGGQSFEATFDVSYTLNNQPYNSRIKRNFTTIFDPVVFTQKDSQADKICQSFK